MYYSYKNCRISIDNQPLYVNSLNLNVEATIGGDIQNGKSLSDYYVPENGRNNSARISYYMTGDDLLKNYFSDDSRFVKLYFGGLYFESGCVTSYSVNGTPNSPVTVEADISFYGDIKGVFTPTYDNPVKPTFFNYSECIITGAGFGDLTRVRGFSYKAAMSVQEGYKDDENRKIVEPDFISFGPQQVSLTLNYDNITGDIPTSGRDGQIYIKRGNIEIIPYISGKIFSKTIDINSNGAIEGSVTIKKDTIIPPPEIYGFFPTGGLYGSPVRISGVNFRTVKRVYYANKMLFSPAIINNNIIQVSLFQRTPLSGTFTVVSQGGVAESTGYYGINNGSIGGF